jgi:uncharacterized protein (TIGR03435 family)
MEGIVITPVRFGITANVCALIALAYGKDRSVVMAHDLISPGPGWTRSDRFVIQAVIPEGSVNYTALQLSNLQAPNLQLMIRNLLADRFKLVLHPEQEERAVYELVLNGGSARLRCCTKSETLI